MAVDAYDRGLIAKISKVFANVIYQERSFVFHTLTDKNAKVSVPLISVFRPDGWSVSSSNTDSLSKRFLNGVRQLPVDLIYQVDIWANTREDLEELTAELLMYLIANPSFVIEYKSADGTKSVRFTTSLLYVSGPERSSEMEDTTVGRIYRYTLTFSLDSAYILVFQPTELNPDGSVPEGYASKVTQVIVEVIPEIDINLIGKGEIPKYTVEENINE